MRGIAYRCPAQVQNPLGLGDAPFSVLPMPKRPMARVGRFRPERAVRAPTCEMSFAEDWPTERERAEMCGDEKAEVLPTTTARPSTIRLSIGLA